MTAFHVPYLSDKIPEAVFHGQAVKPVAYLRISTTQQDVRSERLAILDAIAKAVNDREKVKCSGRAPTRKS